MSTTTDIDKQAAKLTSRVLWAPGIPQEPIDGTHRPNPIGAVRLLSLLAARSNDRENCLVHLETISRLAEATANEQNLSTYYYAAEMTLMLES